MGDLFFHKMTYPFVDRGSGGSVRGVIAAADRALAMANDTTKIIPGHGPVATKADLAAYRKMLSEIVAKVDAGVKAKKSLEQIKAARPADGYDVKADGFITADGFVETVYGELTGE
jgi:glyoxylase-like metal-dependent hydrolase (beta-lactamase superfamily II)